MEVLINNFFNWCDHVIKVCRFNIPWNFSLRLSNWKVIVVMIGYLLWCHTWAVAPSPFYSFLSIAYGPNITWDTVLLLKCMY